MSWFWQHYIEALQDEAIDEPVLALFVALLFFLLACFGVFLLILGITQTGG